MLSVRPVWWIPIIVCIVVGIVSLIPLNTAEDSTFLPYQPIIPLAPISTLLIWIVGGGLFYMLGRWATARPIRSPYR
jgi:hypothetical protein